MPLGSSLRNCGAVPWKLPVGTVLGVEKPVLWLYSSGFCAEKPVLCEAAVALLWTVLALVPRWAGAVGAGASCGLSI